MVRLRGGVDSSTHAVELEPGGWVVLKRSWSGRGRSLAWEFERLTFARRAPVPTPEPIALDATGEWFDGPALVMSRMPGRSSLHGGQAGPWLTQLAEALVAVHLTTLPVRVPAVLRRPHAWQEWQPGPDHRPDRTGKREAVVAAALSLQRELRARPPQQVFVHHDFHPGNVAWHRGRLSAVLDWNEARLGPAVSDVAYCSVDLAMSHGAPAADWLVSSYQDASGHKLEDLARWQLLWIANATRWVHYWQAGFRELGLGHVSLPTLRRRLGTFAGHALDRM